MKWLNRKKQLSHSQEFAILKYNVFPLFWEKVEPLWETGYYKWLKVAQRLSNATIYPGRPPIRQLLHNNISPEGPVQWPGARRFGAFQNLV